MKTIIVNGNPYPSNKNFDSSLNKLSDAIKSNSNQPCNIITLRELDLRPCIGCFGCWVKSPGECQITDQSLNVREQIIQSELVIFASPLILGYTSALLKTIQDKLLPLLLPYVTLVNKECHHEKRYANYPLLALLYQEETDTDEEDIKILSDLYKRMALNFRSKIQFIQNINTPIEEIIHEINHN